MDFLELPAKLLLQLHCPGCGQSGSKVKDFLAEKAQDGHVVHAEGLAVAARASNVTDEGGPEAGPFLLDNLKKLYR